jgi:predicted transcriptional regulator
MAKKITTVSMENDRLGFYINVCGKKYRMTSTSEDKDGHFKKTVFKVHNDEKYKRRLDDIAEYLDKHSHLDTRTIIFEAIKHMSEKDMKRIEKEIDKKTRVRVKRGCVALMIGKAHISIVE